MSNDIMLGGDMICAGDVCSLVISDAREGNNTTSQMHSDGKGACNLYINFTKGTASHQTHPFICWQYMNREVAVNNSIAILRKKQEIENRNKAINKTMIKAYASGKRRRTEPTFSPDEKEEEEEEDD